jgi:integrase
VLTLLADFCAGQGITLLKDITLSVITEWQHTWTLKSPAAKRGRQEKIRNFFRFAINHEYIVKNPISAWKSVKLDTNDLHVSEGRIIRAKVYAKIMKAIDETQMTPENRARVKACMRLQREAGLAIVDAVTLHKSELTKEAGRFRIKTNRQKTGTTVNVPITEKLGRLLLEVKNGNPEYFFASGNTLPEDAPSYFQKLYRKVFNKAGVEHTSHDLRHTYAATFLEAGGDIRLLSKALGHSSINVTEKYYAHFTRKQQDMLDKAAEKALAAMSD